MSKIDGIAAARIFTKDYYPDCLAALLFGSVARGEATLNSDLDILIVIEQEISFYRKSYSDYGWLIEAFVGSQTFYEEKVIHPGTNRKPSLLTSFAEAIILKDHNNFAHNLKEKAITIIEQGPEPLTDQEINQYRYIITDWLDDLSDCMTESEALFIAPELVVKSAELLLAYNRRWSGDRRLLYRALEKLDHQLSKQLVEAATEFYRTGRKDRLIEVIEAILELVGGRLYEGYEKAG